MHPPFNSELYADAFFKVSSPRFHFASSLCPGLVYICSQALGVTRTWTSIYEVSFSYEETCGNKVLLPSDSTTGPA